MVKKYYCLLLTLFVFINSFSQGVDAIVQTLEIDTLLNNGPKDNRINIAFSNITNNVSPTILYNSKAELHSAISEILTYFEYGHINAKSGFSNYRNFFNVQSVWFPDPLEFKQEPEFYAMAHGIRDALFLPWLDEEKGWATMIFSGALGNGAGVQREKRTGDVYMGELWWETVLHEFNHTMPGLYDEYTASGAWSNYQCIEGPNVTGQIELNEVPWRKWIEQSAPLPTPYDNAFFNDVGLFEGNISGYFGCYRPTARSCYMGAGGFGENFGQDICSVCLQRFITMLYKYVNVIENPQPSTSHIDINGNTSIQFSADIIKPEPNTQKYEWFLNGKLFASGQESIEISFNACDQYTIDLVVTDTTESVRFDEKFKDLYPNPIQKHSWYVANKAVSSYDLIAETRITNADCKGIANGEISIVANGGLAPYTYTINGDLYNSSRITNLSVGKHDLVITDANGCSIYQEIEINQDPVLGFELCSSYMNGNWEISALVPANVNQELTYLWSNGETDSSLITSQEGFYFLDITNSTGCTTRREITLSPVEKSINLSYEISNATKGLANGSLFLEIQDGLQPYEISWFTGQLLDLTSYHEESVISSGNGEISIHLPKFAFDNDLSYGFDFWAENFTGNNFLGYDFGEKTEIESYSITSNVDVKERDAKSWILQGSDDNQTWTDIDIIAEFEFPERLQTFEFGLEVPASYRYFRLLFTQNWGGGFDGWIAIQQVEFGIIIKEEITQHKNKKNITDLSPGVYYYEVEDLNKNCLEGSAKLINVEVHELSPITIFRGEPYEVKVENPDPNLSYYWTGTTDDTILNIGTNFLPATSGTYFVRPYIDSLAVFGREKKGFSITKEDPPLVENIGDRLKIIKPKLNCEYYWYDVEYGSQPIHIGTEFTPDYQGVYYVSALKIDKDISPLDPAEIEGLSLWMDAADLDGNGVLEDNLEDSSAYTWKFRKGGQWAEDNWFPYRSNYQNGNGVVDFSTMWFQYLNTSVSKLRTVILAYEESSFSMKKSAPLHGLNTVIPKHSDASQLLSNETPATTLNGEVYLNGTLVDPLTQGNPMDFIVLSFVFSEMVDAALFASDENWEGKLGELLVWDSPLSKQQIFGVNEYLKRKWLTFAELESPRASILFGDDTDGDGILNDVDNCPEIANSNQKDLDSDGIGDVCDDDWDGDGILNDVDNCPEISNENQEDLDGDGIGDICDDDIDGDGILNEVDICPEMANVGQEDFDDDGFGDVCDDDIDGDGVLNEFDSCPETPIGISVDANGCELLGSDNFTLEIISETCPDKDNGQLIIESQNKDYTFSATLNGVAYEFSDTKTFVNLEPGDYEVCIVVTNVTAHYCYNFAIEEGTTTSAKASTTESKTSVEMLSGTAPYNVFINGQSVLRTMSNSFDVDTKHGDLIEVKTDVACEGVYSKTVQLFNIITLYPNPTEGLFELAIPLNLNEVGIELYNYNSQLISKRTYPISFGKVQMDLTDRVSGMYYVKVLSGTSVMLKIIKI